MSELDDGGPVFPVSEEDARGKVAGVYGGMTKRELFAAILMHSEAVTCGVPGEACEALVEASRGAGTDVIDHMAMNAVQGADALLRALGAPPEPKFRELQPYDQRRIDAAERLANLVNAMKSMPGYLDLPVRQREAIQHAIDDVLDPEIPF